MQGVVILNPEPAKSSLTVPFGPQPPYPRPKVLKGSVEHSKVHLDLYAFGMGPKAEHPAF